MRWIFSVRIAVVFSLVAWPLAADWQEGIAAFQSGEYATAEAEFRAVIEGQPSWPGGHLMLGQTLLRRGRGDQALPHLERAYELADDAQTALALSQTYLHLERFDDVARTLEGRDPAGLAQAQQAAFYKTRGLAAIKREQVASALSDLREAARAAPRDGEIHYLLATAAKAAGQG
ncbi:MAG: tetratricopeptide repeat protein, partial [bacterium]|nr:tetratricopeptide repeat protein [bacterium]